MELKEYAQWLGKKEYGYPQFTDEEIEIAKENGFVIVSGVSDDLMEFDGAIYDEVDCYEGKTVWVDETGVTDSNTETPNHRYIKALWCNDSEGDGERATWTYKTDIPHETFEIYDNGKLYCRGIVFSVDEVKKE